MDGGFDSTALDGAVPVDDGGPDASRFASDGALLPPPVASLDGGADATVMAGLCQPTAGGPYWPVEGQPVTATVSCLTGLKLPAGSFSIDALPTGATFDASTATLSWTPTLSQGATYVLTLHASGYAETGSLKIGVADKFDDPANVPVTNPATYTEEMGLPVIHLTVDPHIDAVDYTPATVIYRGHTYDMTMAQTRGTFSQSFPKRSYTVKFTKDDKFSEPLSAGGFNDKRKITLISPFNDNSYIRSRTVFDLWNAMDPAHIQVKSYSAVVFLNGAYWGLYTVMDHVDEYLMEDFGLEQSGNLFKAREHAANYRLVDELGKTKATLHDGYTKEEGTPIDGEPGAYDDLDAIVSFVATASDADFLAQIDSKIVRKEYEDWFLLVSYMLANDSIDKNSYHYHDPMDAQGRWHYIPWDMDESLGQNFATVRESAQSDAPEAGRYTTIGNHLFERILAQPTMGGPLRQRYGALLHGGAFDLAQLLPRLDATAADVELSAERDQSKWGAQYASFSWVSYRNNDFVDHKGEVAYVRKWLMDRYAYIDSLY